MKLNHFDNFIVLITGILRNKKGQLLLIRRSKNNKTFRGFWHLPEGKIEFGEQPIETLKRELKEELNCRLISGELVLANSTVVNFQKTTYYLLRICFQVKWEGEIRLSEEHDDYRWLTLKEAFRLPKLVPGVKEVLLVLKPRQ